MSGHNHREKQVLAAVFEKAGDGVQNRGHLQQQQQQHYAHHLMVQQQQQQRGSSI
jgi:hypothetical protein